MVININITLAQYGSEMKKREQNHEYDTTGKTETIG